MRFLVAAPAQLGNTLRGLRKARGMSQVDLAARSGIGQKTVSLLETAPQRCSVESLFRYLGVVGSSVSLEQATPARPSAKSEPW